MKRLGTQAQTIKVIEGDRLFGFNNAIEIIEGDLFKVLREYFDIAFPPEIKIEKNGDKYSLLISAVCDGLKSFGKI